VWAIIVTCAHVHVVWQTDGATPLYAAASREGHVEVVRALVAAGAAVNPATVRDDGGGAWCCGMIASVSSFVFMCVSVECGLHWLNQRMESCRFR